MARLSAALNASGEIIVPFRTPKFRRFDRFGRYFWQFMRRAPLVGGFYSVDRVAEFLDEHRNIEFDVVHFDSISFIHLRRSIVRLFESRGLPVPVFVASISDSYSLSMRNVSHLRYIWAKCVESAHLAKFDSIHVVAERDAEYLRQKSKRTVAVVPLIVPTPDGKSPDFHERDLEFAYLGSLSGSWGEDLVSFCNTTLPTIAKIVGREIFVVVAGKQDPKKLAHLGDLSMMRFVGEVDDPVEFFRRVRFAVVPSRQGHGTPTKALEAMAGGAVCMGAEALDGLAIAGRRAAVRTDRNEKIDRDRLISVLTDERVWGSMSAAGHEYARTSHSVASVSRAYWSSIGLDPVSKS